MRFRAFNLCVLLPGLMLLLVLAGAACQCTFLWGTGPARYYFGFGSDQFVAGYYRIAGFRLQAPAPLQFIPESALDYEDEPADAAVHSSDNSLFRTVHAVASPRGAGAILISVWKIALVLLLPAIWFFIREMLREERWDKRKASLQCPRCGYEMIHTPERCPECGMTKGTPRPTHVPRYFSTYGFWAISLSLIVTIFVLIAMYQNRLYAADAEFFKAMHRADYTKALSLLDQVSSANIEDRTEFHVGSSALLMAIEADQPDLVKQLLLRHALTEHPGSCPALNWAIQRGSVQEVSLLLDSGESMEKPWADFGTALHTAVNSGKKEMVALLLERGASLSARDAKGRTPLDLAREENEQSIIDMLEGAAAQTKKAQPNSP